jgi:hypothetical protein
MSSLYNEIIKKNYNIPYHDITASDFLKLMCSTTNIDDNTKNILKSALREVHKKRKEYNQSSMFQQFSDYINPSIETYRNTHNISNTTKIYKFIWDNISDEVKNSWDTSYSTIFRYDCRYTYPYLIHLYDINQDEGKFINREPHRCGLICNINKDRCFTCKHVFKPETNVIGILNKLLINIKNDYDIRFITTIINKSISIRNYLRLNNKLCKIYLRYTIEFTKGNFPNDIIELRIELKDYMKMHEIIRKRVINHKLRKFIKLCKSNSFKKLFWSNKHPGGKWMQNKFIGK